jgi:hypothetical protein
MEAMTTTSSAARSSLAGWSIVGWATLVVVAIQLAVLAVAGSGEEGVRMAIRASARTSVVLFGLAFVASSLYRLAPNAFSRWLLANRRYLGVSFASSHAIHLVAIIALAKIFDAELAPLILMVGGVAYVFIAAMTATSFDSTARWLGARYIWFVFFVSYLPKPDEQITAIPSFFFALVVAMAVIRIAAWWKARA